jgi:hypothetical protein
MQTTRKLIKAKLVKIRWNNSDTPEVVSGGDARTVEVQFNPSSLKVSYANQVQNNDQSTGSSMQYVGKGTSKLALELIFDVSVPGNQQNKDVRQLTRNVAEFMATTSTGSGENTRYTVPGVRFEWGTFTFDGVIESMDETLDLFSEDGYPLRATVSVNMSYQGITVVEKRNPDATNAPSTDSPTGTKRLTPSMQGDSLQQIVASAGGKMNWKAVASANGIENPRNLRAGTLIDLNVKASGNIAGGVSAGASMSITANLNT